MSGDAEHDVVPAAELGFEDAFVELERTVERLESEDLPLEDALALYERGLALSERCQALLDDAQAKVRDLGRVAGQPLDPSGSDP